MQKIQFTKMEGLGNDFMVVDGVRQHVELTPEQIVRLADRQFGIGFNQLLLVETSVIPDVDFFYKIFNADGSEVTQCGNGARCLARFVREQKLSDKEYLIVETHSSHLELVYKDDENISVNMGPPTWLPETVPFLANKEALRYPLKTVCGDVEISVVNVGNPHCVLVVDDVANAPVAKLGSQLTIHDAFPEGVNVGFMQVIDRDHIALRVYERGVGETLACGSGACAAVVVGQRLGFLDHEVSVGLAGGKLLVTWEGHQRAPVWLTGPAVTVFTGEILIPT